MEIRCIVETPGKVRHVGGRRHPLEPHTQLRAEGLGEVVYVLLATSMGDGIRAAAGGTRRAHGTHTSGGERTGAGTTRRAHGTHTSGGERTAVGGTRRTLNPRRSTCNIDGRWYKNGGGRNATGTRYTHERRRANGGGRNATDTQPKTKHLQHRWEVV